MGSLPYHLVNRNSLLTESTKDLMALPCGGRGGGEDTAAGMFRMWTGVEVRGRGTHDAAAARGWC